MIVLDNIGVKRKLDEIGRLIHFQLHASVSCRGVENIGLYKGNMGIALFLYEYAMYDQSKFVDNCKLIVRLVDQAFVYIRESDNSSRSLYNGITGTLCAIEFLKQQKIIGLEEDYISDELIEYLEAESLKDTLQYNYCDLLHGGLGFLMFLVENKNIPNWHTLVEKQLDALSKIEIPISPDKLNWRISLDFLRIESSVEDADGINLGLAHGISGIIILLTKLKKLGFSSSYIDNGISRGMNLILSNKLKDERSTSLYPSGILNNQPILDSRLAWCNGDLCIALAAWHSWEVTRNEKYRLSALEILDHAAGIDPKNAYATDYGICHGTAGISHIFRKFYWDTNNESYRDAANFWANQTLAMADSNIQNETIKTCAGGHTAPHMDLLDGVSGVGLSLISALSNQKRSWDRFLLIS